MESFPISNINSYDDLEITQLEDHDCSSLLFFFPTCEIRKTDYVINVFILITHSQNGYNEKFYLSSNSVFVAFGKE